MATKIKWNKAEFKWESNPHTWDYVVEQIKGGANKRNKWKKDKDKKKRKEVIKLVMWRKGIKVYDEAKEIENIELYIDDIELIAEEIKRNVQIIHG
jgi:hypothetical protein